MEGGLGPLSERDWLAAARSLGADVPFFLCGTGALVEGIGDRVTPLGRLPPWWVLVVRPRVAVPTAAAYHALVEQRRTSPPPIRPRATSRSLEATDGLQRGDFRAVSHALTNDFHALILAAYPEIARAEAALRAAGAAHVVLSGSGSCVFALFPNEDAARTCDAELDRSVAELAFVAPFHHDARWSGPPKERFL